MIITGGPTSRASTLAAYLVRTGRNEKVEVADVRGVAADDLRGGLCEMEAVALGATCRQPLYHASISPPADAGLTEHQWQRSVRCLEDGLQLTGQPRVVVAHVKAGRRHLHAVWLRVHAASMRVISCAHDRLTHRTVARQLEREFGHAPPQSVAATRQGAAPTWAELQQAGRAGIDLGSIEWALAQAWQADDVARAVGERSTLILARGDRGGPVVVDEYGGVYSVARRLGSVPRPALRARADALADLPSVAAVRDDMFHYRAGIALANDLSRQARAEAEAPVLAAARAMLDRGLGELRACELADPNVDDADRDDATSPAQQRHRARLAGRLGLARQLVEALTDSPDGQPDQAVFVGVPDEPLWWADLDLLLFTGPVPAVLERLRRAGIRLTERDGPGQRQTVACSRAEVVAVVLGAGRPGAPVVDYELVDMLAEALTASRAVAAGDPDDLAEPMAVLRVSGTEQARRREARQQVGRDVRAALGTTPGADGTGTVEWLLTDGEAGGRMADSPMSRLLAMLRDRQVPVTVEPAARGPGQASLQAVRVSVAALVECASWLWEAAREAAAALLRLLRDAASLTRRRGQGRAALGALAPPRDDRPVAGIGSARAAVATSPEAEVGGPAARAAGPALDGADPARARTGADASRRARAAEEERAHRDRIAAHAQRERDALIASDPILRAALAGPAAAGPPPPAVPAASGPQRTVAARTGGGPASTAPPVAQAQAAPARPPAVSAPTPTPEVDGVALGMQQLLASARAAQDRRDAGEAPEDSLRAAMDQLRLVKAAQAAAAAIDKPPRPPVRSGAADRPAAGPPPPASPASGAPSPVAAPGARSSHGRDTGTARRVGDGEAAPSPPYTHEQAMRVLRSGDVIQVSDDEHRAIFWTTGTETRADEADDRRHQGGLFGLSILLSRAGVGHARQAYTPETGLVIEYRVADLAAMLAAQTRQNADGWVARLRLATAQTRVRQARAEEIARRRAEAKAARPPRGSRTGRDEPER